MPAPTTDATEPRFKDYAKPEVLVALVDTWALCGFREPAEALTLVEGLGVRTLEPLREALRVGGPEGTRAALSWVLLLDDRSGDEVVRAAAAAALELAGGNQAEVLVFDLPGEKRAN